MIAWLLSLAVAPAAEFEVTPREADWEQVQKSSFQPGWIVPEDSRRSLLPTMRKLLIAEYMEDGTPKCFGDLVAEARDIPPQRREAWLSKLDENAPQIMRRWGPALRELLLTDYLFSDKWKPSKDHPRDGILMVDGWELDRKQHAGWKSVKKKPRFEQGAALYYADLATIKDIENDYRSYPSNVGANYEEIYPMEGGHLFGNDAEGEPFRFVRIFFESDIPFPFSTYKCDLRILNRIDSDGVLRADIYSASPDFHYMAGQDVFLPVDTSEGETVAYLVVRDFGFDLSGVPDGPKHCSQALRSTLGNMKRNAERRFRSAGSAVEESAASPAEALKTIRVRGRR